MSLAALEPQELSEAAARKITDEIKAHTESAWKLLTAAHEGRAWKSLGYSTWAAYVGEEFSLTRSRSYHLIDQGRVIREIEDAVSTSVDISEAAARDIKPILTAVVTEISDKVAALGDSPEPEAVQAVVADVIADARPVTKVTDTHKEEAFYDSTSGEQVAPVKLPSVPKLDKPMKVLNAEQLAADFARSIYAVAKASTPEGRAVILETWALGFEAASPVMREYVNPTWFRAIASGLNALANKWEKS